MFRHIGTRANQVLWFSRNRTGSPPQRGQQVERAPDVISNTAETVAVNLQILNDGMTISKTVMIKSVTGDPGIDKIVDTGFSPMNGHGTAGVENDRSWQDRK